MVANNKGLTIIRSWFSHSGPRQWSEYLSVRAYTAVRTCQFRPKQQSEYLSVHACYSAVRKSVNPILLCSQNICQLSPIQHKMSAWFFSTVRIFLSSVLHSCPNIRRSKFITAVWTSVSPVLHSSLNICRFSSIQQSDIFGSCPIQKSEYLSVRSHKSVSSRADNLFLP